METEVPKYWSGVMSAYCFAMAILVILIILPSSASILSGTFLRDALIKLYETL
jgi:hypothetical protein